MTDPSPEALVASQPAAPPREVPTIAQWVPVVSGLVGEGTRKLYSTYWNRLMALWRERRLDELPASDLTWLFGHIRQKDASSYPTAAPVHVMTGAAVTDIDRQLK